MPTVSENVRLLGAGSDQPTVKTTRPAREVDDLDMVARIIEQFVGLGLFIREMWRDQSKVAGALPPQQVVERPSGVVQRFHVALPSRSALAPAVPTITDHIRFLCAQVYR